MFENMKKFVSDESGVSAVEYALVAAGTALAIGAALSQIGGDLEGIFSSLKDNVSNANGANSGNGWSSGGSGSN